MSVVTFRDGVMAADKRAYSGTSAPIGFKRKVHRLLDGTLVGVVTNQVGLAEAIVNWIERGANAEDTPNHDPEFDAIVVRPNGEVFYWSGGWYPSGPLTDEFFAIGSGSQYALGAMVRGASAKEAAYVAIQLDPFCGGNVDSYELAA